MAKKTVNKKTSAVIVAGGMGKRLGADVPKAFVRLGDKFLFEYSLEIFLSYPKVFEIILVVPEAAIEQAEDIINSRNPDKTVVIVNGGGERWESVRNGVLSVAESSQWVLIHDAARPFVTPEIIDSLLKKRVDFKCAITATPVDDTIRRFEKEVCTETVDRSSLLRVGTPQLFQRQSLCDAFTHAGSMTPPPTDEAMLMEKCGITVGFVWGDPKNFKITTQHDLEVAKAMLSYRKR